MATPKKKIGPLDEAKLQAMDGPLTVTLTRLKDGRSTPIPMFSRTVNDPPGKNFTRDDVRNLAEPVLKYSGGGYYIVSVSTDQNLQHEFELWLDPSQFGEKVPAGMVAAAHGGGFTPPGYAAPAPQPAPLPVPSFVQVQQQPQGAPQMSSMDMSQVAAGYARPQVQQQQQPAQATITPITAAVPAAPVVVENQDRLRALEEKLRQTEEERRREHDEAAKREAAHEREKLQALHAASLASLQDEVRKLREQQAAVVAQPPVEGETVRLMREQLDRMNRALEEQKQQRASDTVTTLMMEMQKQQQAIQQQNQQQMLQLMTAMTQRPQVDPMVQLMLEQLRQQADSAREQARLQAEQAREQARSAIGIKDVVDLANNLRQQNSGSEQMLKSVNEAYMGIFQLQKAQAELQRELQGGGNSPAVEMISQALQGVQGMAQQYFEMKGVQAQAEAQAKIVEAQALARAAGQPLAAAGPAAPAPAQAKKKKGNNVVPLRPVEGGAPKEPTSGADVRAQQIADMELKMFGDAQVVEQVRRLRLGIAKGNVSVDQAVLWVKRAVNMIAGMGMQSKVQVITLLQNGMVDDFVRALVPDAPQPYIIEFVGKLTQAMQNPNAPLPAEVAEAQAAQAAAAAGGAPAMAGGAGGEAEDDEEDEDEDDEEENEPA